jgi:hypothetical protein
MDHAQLHAFVRPSFYIIEQHIGTTEVHQPLSSLSNLHWTAGKDGCPPAPERISV